MVTEFFVSIGPLISRSLSAAIAIISASFFFYILLKDIRNRVGRTFSALLFFVMITYIGDLGVSYSQNIVVAAPWLQLQWVGIAFVPAIYVHLSDAILELTGLPSRGRRKRLTRVLYIVSTLLLGLVLFTGFITTGINSEPAPHFLPGPGFPIFVLYFLSAVITSYWFILRARARTLTPSSSRRMSYLVLTYAAPALAVFPFLLISGQSLKTPVIFYVVLIIVDVVLAVTLSYMAYLLSFFGATLPERVIKAQMLKFFLRGPVIAISALAIILFVPSAGNFLRLPGEEVMPFVTVVTILFLQWLITITFPLLRQIFIYSGDEAGEIQIIHDVEVRLLTGADFRQLLDAILAATCDYLRTESAFVASMRPDGPRLERGVRFEEGKLGTLSGHALAEKDEPEPADITRHNGLFIWQDYWIIPLYAEKLLEDTETTQKMVGILGVAAPSNDPLQENSEQWSVLMNLAQRATDVLEARRIHSEVFAALEGTLPDITMLQRRANRASQGDIEQLTHPNEKLLHSGDFSQKVKAALGHYWGGPRLTDDVLMNLQVVQEALREHENNPQRAVRAVLESAIENLRPEGQRSMTTTEWILYNILEMRFIQGRKVRDVALRLAMSEADFYRKQRVAIETVAEIIADMERASYPDDTSNPEIQPHKASQTSV